MSGQDFIPQMRVPPSMGARGLSAAWRVNDGVGVVSLRGIVDPDNLDVMLAAIDAVIGTGVRALVLDGDDVHSWSIRGLEVAILTAVRAELQFGFAMSGLPLPELDLIRRQWPGIAVERFSFPTAAAAVAAARPPVDSGLSPAAGHSMPH